MIRIMLCEDIRSIRDYLKKSIDSQEDMEVICAVSSGIEAVKHIKECKGEDLPDIILMDIQMEDEKAGITATGEIHTMYPEIKIIMLTIHENDDLLIEAYMVGAVDYLVKNKATEEMCATLRRAKENKDFIGTIIREKTREKLHQSRKMEVSMLFFINKMSKLTNSEWRILRHLYEGRNRRDIAKIEVLSEETVKLHIRHILRKLEFTSNREMTDYLKEIGLLDYYDWEE